MKNFKYILLTVSISLTGLAQDQVIQDNASSYTITPGGIMSKMTYSGQRNLNFGQFALQQNTGDDNTAIGYQSLQQNTSGSKNTAVGLGSLSFNETGIENTAVGAYALQYNTTGSNNTAFGAVALSTNTIGFGNTAFGYAALQENINGNQNTAIGYQASKRNANGTQNTAIGYQALGDGITGSYNLAAGYQALWKNTGNSNVALGSYAMQYTTVGNDNVAIGSGSMVFADSGSNNVAIGQNALRVSKGSNNTILGFQSHYNNVNGSHNVAIGYQAGFNETGSNTLYIENSDSDRPLIGGDFFGNKVGINRTIAEIQASSNALQVNGDASKNSPGSWIGHSDARLKTNIQALSSAEMLQKVLQMQGVTYEWNDQVTGSTRPEGLQYGFIAQELQKIWPEMVKEDGMGYLTTAYGTFDPMLVESIKALNSKIEDLEKEISIEISQLKTIIDSKLNTQLQN